MERPLLATKWPSSLGKGRPGLNLPFPWPKGRARGGRKSDRKGAKGKGGPRTRPKDGTARSALLLDLDLSFSVCTLSTWSLWLPPLWCPTSHALCCCQGLPRRERDHGPSPLGPLLKLLSAIRVPAPHSQCEEEQLAGYMGVPPGGQS